MEPISVPISKHERPVKQSYIKMLLQNIKRHPVVYLLALPIILYFIVFRYIPIFGVIIAFQDFRPGLGFLNSPWVGLSHFISFFESPFAFRVIRNTFVINIYQIAFGFPAPILLALLLNEVRHSKFKRTVQTMSYLPFFIALVVMCGILLDFSSSRGLFNDIRYFFGFERINLLRDNRYYRFLYVASDIWQFLGWWSIIYMATLSSVDVSLYEAAVIDGANRFKQAIYVTLPALTPIIIIQLIMRLGFIMSEGAEKTLLLYNPLVYETGDIISSFVFRRGLQEMDYSFGMAVSVFNSMINLIMLFAANWFARRHLQESLW